MCGPGYRSKLWGSAHILARLLIAAAAGGNLTTDGHLAMLAIEHGATLGSFDPGSSAEFVGQWTDGLAMIA
ncbi:hypothetical protein BH18PSE1_BH18PSE1_11860 [soil metagenome]